MKKLQARKLWQSESFVIYSLKDFRKGVIFLAKDKPKQRRSFRVIFKLIRLGILLALTFFISFAVTLVMKAEHPADSLGAFSNEVFSEDTVPKRSGAPEIKTLFDDLNKQPFDATKLADDEKISDKPAEKISDDKPPVKEETHRTERREEREPVQSRMPADNLGFFATLDRMTSIKPAVDAKIKKVPHYVTIDKMPFLLCQAVVAVEDQRFYKHKGFDLFGIARAVLVNVEAGEIQEGASTITQQTVKNLFLTSEQTFTRKAEELILSMNMEKDFKKDKILEIYLNVIYFGSNFYGIYEASHGYFGKEPADLTIAECAMLAGLPNAPSLYSPYVDFRLAKKRQLVVIDAMEKSGVITKTEAESARIEEIVLVQQ